MCRALRTATPVRAIVAWSAVLSASLGCAAATGSPVTMARRPRFFPDSSWSLFSMPAASGPHANDSASVSLVVATFAWAKAHVTHGDPTGITYLDPARQQRLLDCAMTRARTVTAYASQQSVCPSAIAAADTASAADSLAESPLEDALGFEPFDFYAALACFWDRPLLRPGFQAPTSAGTVSSTPALTDFQRSQAAAGQEPDVECGLNGAASNAVTLFATHLDSAVATVVIQESAGKSVHSSVSCLFLVRRDTSWTVARSASTVVAGWMFPQLVVRQSPKTGSTCRTGY